MSETNLEYVIWGRPPGEEHEQPLHTKSKDREEAENIMGVLVNEHGITAARIQVLDLNEPPDFVGAILS